MEPNVQFGDIQSVALSGNDGAIDPVAATHALLAAAKKLGATVQFPCELIEITKTAGQVSGVETSTGSINADKVVLATGAEADAGERFAGSAVPQRSTPGVIAITAPLPPILRRILVAPGIHMHQRHDGRMVLGEQDGAPQNEAHGLRLAERPYTFPAREFAEQHFGRMMLIAERFLPAIAGAELDDAYIGWRPLPLDGHPVLGASGAQSDVYLAIMHSGVTLAPVVGQLAALELAEGTIVDQLDEFRPDRNFELIKRY
jgi:glycine/D-amino acid oxidase-like deaminating enzyme